MPRNYHCKPCLDTGKVGWFFRRTCPDCLGDPESRWRKEHPEPRYISSPAPPPSSFPDEDRRKSRVGFLTVSQFFDLDQACATLGPFGFGTYLVGSALTRRDFRDVDLRCILSDEEFDAMFGGNAHKQKFLSVAVSEWLAARTGLPIDFQFQRMTEANAEFKGPRNAMGRGEWK